MSSKRAWHVSGDLKFRNSPSKLSEALCSVGLDAKPGRFAVRIVGCSHFVLRCEGDPVTGGLFVVDADADSETDMVADATMVSKALRAALIEHSFEVYSPENELVKTLAKDG